MAPQEGMLVTSHTCSYTTKIKSLDKMIATLDASVAKNPEDEERIRQEILTLKNKRTFLMKNPNVLGMF